MTNKTNQKERAWERRKANEKYYSDMSKLTFAALVLTQLTMLHDGEIELATLIIGSVLTVGFKMLANKFIKEN